MPLNGSTPTNSPADDKRTDSDAHGKAALLLAESLIHGLCENMTLSANHAVEIADRAASVQHDLAAETEHPDASLWRSHDLLTRIAKSLRADARNDPFEPKLLP